MTDYERLRADANAYHAKHPRVMLLFEEMSLRVARSGKKHFGVAAIWERIRWEINVEAGKDWKMPNNHRAFYARWFNRTHPELEDAAGRPFFRISEQRSRRGDFECEARNQALTAPSA